MKAGEPMSVTLTLYPTSNLFMPGHRIRLDVSSSNFPRFDVNPNTGEAIGRERRRVVAENTVFHERGAGVAGGGADHLAWEHSATAKSRRRPAGRGSGE